MKKLFFTAIACIPLVAATFWVDGSRYESANLLETGDIVLINVTDISDFKFDLKVKNGKNASVDSAPDITITGFLPQVQSVRKIKGDDFGEFTGGSKISFTIAGILGNRLADGRFAVTGVKEYTFNGTANTISVSGTISPSLLKNREIDSSLIGNFRVEISSSRTTPDLQYEETQEDENPEEVRLTDQQKRQLLMQYLNELINEQQRP